MAWMRFVVLRLKITLLQTLESTETKIVLGRYEMSCEVKTQICRNKSREEQS